MQGSFIWDDISKAIPREPWQKWKQKKKPRAIKRTKPSCS